MFNKTVYTMHFDVHNSSKKNVDYIQYGGVYMKYRKSLIRPKEKHKQKQKESITISLNL